MAGDIDRRVRQLALKQHGAVSRQQLLALGFSRHAIDHRIGTGRLHPVCPGVYALGRPELGQLGRWSAAVLACGPHAVLSHESAGALFGFWRGGERKIHLLVASASPRRHQGLAVHRRPSLSAADVTASRRIPVTTPACTLIDLASRHPRGAIEGALNEADLRRLIDLRALRAALDKTPRRPGVAKLRVTIDRRTFTFTRSELERYFLRIVRRIGLPMPLTRTYVNGFEVDFYWPDLGLVVENDGGAFHRTPAQQAADRRRDQAHTAAGLTPLRFTHGQIRYEPSYTEEILTTVAARLAPA
jgi:very-short-patch-repair endonuclease